ncbi:hypothetical protein [Lyngbya aestuarii]|uniref:hypothetical protein n=1 Tax=Lyngbya aestuarii TaxID=118322 RepID=UPI00403E0B1E
MEIYVQSRGFSQEDGYRWLPQMPSIIKNNRINDLIQSEAPSLVLARYDGKLLLLVTSLQAIERKDFRDRSVRNSVAWVVQDSEENEQVLRMIAIRALRDWESLRKDIDETVQFGSEHGFQVFSEKIELLAIKQQELLTSRNLEYGGESFYKISKNSEERQKELANLLEEYFLPNEEGILVVVTKNKAEESLIKARVWRGLSSLVKSENWQVIGDGIARHGAIAPILNAQQNDNQLLDGKILPLIILAATVAGIMMLLGIMF